MIKNKILYIKFVIKIYLTYIENILNFQTNI